MITVHIEKAALFYDKAPVFNDINLVLPAGKWTALIGASGVGKSSLLRLIAGLTLSKEHAQGKIVADNNILVSSQVAYMAQTDLLLPWLTVLENVTLESKLTGKKKSKTEKNIALGLLKQVGLYEATQLYPHQLSGGMRQRTALVRTLIQNKPIILMDEPFSALDAITRYKLQNLAADLLKNKTVLFITHDPNEALRLADDVYLMQGYPASLKLITRLTTEKPRELHDTSIIKLQTLLFHELAKAANQPL